MNRIFIFYINQFKLINNLSSFKRICHFVIIDLIFFFNYLIIKKKYSMKLFYKNFYLYKIKYYYTNIIIFYNKKMIIQSYINLIYNIVI